MTERRQWAVALALLLGGIWMLHGATLAAGLARLPGDLGDTRFNLLVLEHGWRVLRGHGRGSFWSPTWLFWPQPNALAYSDNLVGDLPLYVPWRAFGLDPVRAFGGFLVLCSFGNFAATVALGRTLGLSVLGSAAAASLFAFGMPRSAQLNHPQLLPQFWTPLCFLCAAAAWRSFRGGRKKAARAESALACVCAAVQFAAGIYLGLLLGLAALGAALVLVLGPHRRDVTSFAKATAPGWLGGGALALAALAPLVLPYARAHDQLGGRSLGAIAGMLPRPTSYLLPSPGALLYRPLRGLASSLPVAWEHVMFAGFVPFGALLLLAWALWRKKRLPVSAAATVLGVWAFLCVVTLRIGSWHRAPLDLWLIAHAIPGLDALRAVARVSLVELLASGLAVGIAVTWLRARPALALALALSPLAENWSRCPADVTDAEIAARADEVTRSIGPGCSAFYWRGRSPSDPSFAVQLDAMWASQELGVPTLNGYSGNEPPSWPLADPREADEVIARAWLERSGASPEGLCTRP